VPISSSSSAVTAPRRGRVLVESLVALLLLGGLSALSFSSVQSAAALGGDARQIALLQQAQTAAVERRLPAACDSGAAIASIPRWSWPRLHNRETLVPGPARTQLLLETHWDPSALAPPAARIARVSADIACR